MEKRCSSLSWNWLICTLSHFSPVVNACCILEPCSAYHLKTEQYFEGLTVTFQIRFRYLLSSYVRMVPLFSQDISLHLRTLWWSNRNCSLWVCLNLFFLLRNRFMLLSDRRLLVYYMMECFVAPWNLRLVLFWCCRLQWRNSPFLFNMTSCLLEQDMYWFMPCQFFVLLMLDTFTLLMPCRISIAAGY